MKAKEIIENHEKRIRTLERALVELNTKLEQRSDDLDFDIDLDASGGAGQGIVPTSSFADAAAGVEADEPEVSLRIGGSTDEQKAAYKAFVERKAEIERINQGITQDGDMTVIAGPTDKQLAMRKQLAREIGWEHWTRSEEYDSDPLPPEDAIKAYLAGGPVWLVHYDRDFVKQQTMATRQRMVQDVMETSPELALELSQDILKYEDSNDPSVATDAAHADWDATG